MIRTAITAALFSVAATAVFAAVPIKVETTPAGKILTDQNGMTLYRFAKDSNGVSRCTGACAMKWPPMIATAGAKAEGDYGIMTRKDGKKQWTFRGWPLYHWVGDKAPGQMSGNNVKGVWFVLHP